MSNALTWWISDIIQQKENPFIAHIELNTINTYNVFLARGTKQLTIQFRMYLVEINHMIHTMIDWYRFHCSPTVCHDVFSFLSYFQCFINGCCVGAIIAPGIFLFCFLFFFSFVFSPFYLSLGFPFSIETHPIHLKLSWSSAILHFEEIKKHLVDLRAARL